MRNLGLGVIAAAVAGSLLPAPAPPGKPSPLSTRR